MTESRRTSGKRGLWLLLGLAILVLGFEGHRLAHLLPEMEHWVKGLGTAGPFFFILAVIVLEPFFFPNTLFGITAGVVFGLWKGYAVYFISVYVANLLVYLIGRRILRKPVLRALDDRPNIRNAVAAAETQGTSLVFWIRLLPLNPAVFSYAFGGVRVPFRAVAIGTLGMFPHMFFDVYLGTVAAHVTEMAGKQHANWEAQGAALVLGLVAVAVLTMRIVKIARGQIQAAGVDDSL
ncbi:MAG: VTT domain-containing protein [Myxococcota bacterium]